MVDGWIVVVILRRRKQEAGPAGHDLERHSSMYALVILN